MLKFRDLTVDEIEVRLQSIKVKGGKPSGAVLLLYKNARCDMNILDETVGVENWQRDHFECKGNLFCKIGININYDKPDKEEKWVWKADCGAESNTEKEKGESSDSFKRAGVNFGIGRELYTSPFIWIPEDKINTYDTGRKDKYNTPIFASNDKFVVEGIKIENKRITALAIRNASTKERVFIWQE